MRLIFVVAAFFAWPAMANYTTNCKDLSAVRYCVYQDPASTNFDVIYHLHGRFGRAETWAETNYYTERVRGEWSQRGVGMPTVISVSFGPVWLLAERNSSSYSGLLEILRDQVIPAIEHDMGAPRGRRMLWGESMGGFNSLQLALKSKLFVKAAVLCAPIAAGLTPYDSPARISQWILQSAAYAYYGEAGRATIERYVGDIVNLAKAVWPTPADWLGSDPLVLAANADKASAPEMYINAGFYDPYALYEGNFELVKLLLRRGVKTEWHPEWGDHCEIDIPSLASFLVR